MTEVLINATVVIILKYMCTKSTTAHLKLTQYYMPTPFSLAQVMYQPQLPDCLWVS